ncbi:MAG: class I SAM-dependent methyltransferase, partial [Alphaproteobacteria bacterium]|nr:class I SAM-dependent methyltransferase [Alphaproteobacteria bacterium]
MKDAEWRRANRAHWDERTALHLGPRGYDLSELRAGRGRLNAIEDAELPPLAGKRVLHLQCHFGADSLKLAQRGAASVVGLDFSRPAIEAARTLAQEARLSDRVHFV